MAFSSFRVLAAALGAAALVTACSFLGAKVSTEAGRPPGSCLGGAGSWVLVGPCGTEECNISESGCSAGVARVEVRCGADVYTGTLSDQKISFTGSQFDAGPRSAGDPGTPWTCEATPIVDSRGIKVDSFAGSCTAGSGATATTCAFDAVPRASVDAGLLPSPPRPDTCSATHDCVCDPGKSCAFACTGDDGCKATCAAGSTCSLMCGQHPCTLVCNDATCAQTSCLHDCKGVATGTSSFSQDCVQGECALTCDPSVTSCSQTSSPFSKTTCTGCPADAGASADGGT